MRYLLGVWLFLSLSVTARAELIRQGAHKNILVLASYHRGYGWSDNMLRGVFDVLGQPDKYELYVEYMDTKRVDDEGYLRQLADLYQHKYRARPLDLVLSCDDHALDFAVHNRERLFKDVPLVFCGINDFFPSRIAGQSQITGVVEANDFHGALELILRLHPKTRQIVFLHGFSKTGLAYRNHVKRLVPQFADRVQIEFLNDIRFADLPKALKALPKENCVLLFGAFTQDSMGRFLPYKAVRDLVVCNSNLPVYSLFEDFVGGGVIGGRVLSGYDQGRAAAQIAQRVLSGEPIASIPIQQNVPNHNVFDYPEMQRLGLSTRDLPKGTRIVNHPETFYYLHRQLVWSVGATIFFLLALVAALVFNIGRRHHVQRALRESEERLELALAATGLGLWDWDNQTGEIVFDKRWCEILGHSQGELDAKYPTWEQRVHEADKPSVMEKLNAHLNGQTRFFESEYRMRTKKGNWRWILSRGKVVKRTKNGLPLRTIGTNQDITARKVAEEERLRLVTAVEQASESIIITDAEGIIQYANPAFDTVIGHSRREALKTDVCELLGAPAGSSLRQLVNERVKQGEVWQGHLTTRRPDQSIMEMEATISPVRNDSGQVENIVFVQHDVTHELELERQLRQNLKMEAIGTLAGGIAHDFNNILSGILGYAQLLQMALPTGSKEAGFLEQITKAGQRASELVKQILLFSRCSEQERQPLRLQPIVKETLTLLRGSIPPTVEIRQHISPQCALVKADPSQIHQIVMNLCTNAYQAMGEKGGQLEVSLESRQIVDEPANHLPPLPPGDYVCLTVKDTGSGMDQLTQEHIFEPYFSTKDSGEGTGLGLATVHGIVQSYKGSVQVFSEPGKGATFTILLPVCQPEKRQVAPPKLENESIHGRERVLFVDDENTLSELGKVGLTELGYKVTAYTDSLKALQAFQENPQQFDILVTDQMMPQLSGGKLAQKLQALRADLPVIICSGFTSSSERTEGEGLVVSEYLMKPATVCAIAAAIRRALD
jgi:PAS domain S-box-containing protein